MKYYLINDIKYLIGKRKNIILIFLLAPLTVFLINSDGSSIGSFVSALALNFDIKDHDVLKTILFILNIGFSLFILVDLYIKDINYQTDNIFLREKIGVYISRKVSLSFMIIVVLKMIQYLLVSVLVFVFKGDFVFLKRLFLIDIVYNLMLGYLLLIVLFICRRNVLKILLYILFLTFILYIPKNFMYISISDWSIKTVLLFCFVIMFFIIFFIKKHKYIFNISREVK